MINYRVAESLRQSFPVALFATYGAREPSAYRPIRQFIRDKTRIHYQSIVPVLNAWLMVPVFKNIFIRGNTPLPPLRSNTMRIPYRYFPREAKNAMFTPARLSKEDGFLKNHTTPRRCAARAGNLVRRQTELNSLTPHIESKTTSNSLVCYPHSVCLEALFYWKRIIYFMYLFRCGLSNSISWERNKFVPLMCGVISADKSRFSRRIL